MCLQI
jgi:hypothetical protein